MQVEIHGISSEQAILCPPGLRLCQQKGVLERRSTQRIKARIDALDIGVQHRALPGGHAAKLCPRAVAEAMDAQLAVDGACRRAEQFAEFARTGAPQLVHLEEPLLRVQVTDCVGKVGL